MGELLYEVRTIHYIVALPIAIFSGGGEGAGLKGKEPLSGSFLGTLQK